MIAAGMLCAAIGLQPASIVSLRPRAAIQRRGAVPVCLEDGEWEIGSINRGHAVESTLTVKVAGKEMQFSKGEMARQASGAVTVIQGDTHVFCSACFEEQVMS